jgi:hypothetical protein
MTVNTRIRTLTILATAIAAITIATPGTANAATASSDYGQHVRHCAQTMGFTGDHNPGMHQGKAGWDGMTCQP